MAMPVSSGLRAAARTRGASRSARELGAGGTSDEGEADVAGRTERAAAAGTTATTRAAAITRSATLQDRRRDRRLEARGGILGDDSHSDRARIVAEQERAV